MKPNMKKKYHPVPTDSLSHRLVLPTGTLGSSLAFIHPKSTGMKKNWYFWDGLLASFSSSEPLNPAVMTILNGW